MKPKTDESVVGCAAVRKGLFKAAEVVNMENVAQERERSK